MYLILQIFHIILTALNEMQSVYTETQLRRALAYSTLIGRLS